MSKIALVTGSTRGIGKSIAYAFAKKGYTVILHGSKKSESSTKFLKDIRLLSPTSQIYYFDISDKEKISAECAAITKRFKKVDVLVNNAGIVINKLFSKMTFDDFDKVMRVNLYGTYFMCKQFIPSMMENMWGRIINLSSISASRGEFGQVNYSASKAAILGLTKSLAKEVARFNITVNAVSPGVVETDILKDVSPEYMSKIIENIPLKRMAKTEEIAKLVLFLASSESSYITGSNISINGGWY